MIKTKMVLILLFIALPLAPTSGWAEFYLGLYGGGSFASNVDPDFEFHDNPGPNRIVAFTRTPQNVRVDPAPLVGGKIGYWFARESYFGLKSPGFLKHLGFELDISYQPLNWPTQTVLVSPLNQYYTINNNGDALTLAFMFMFRLGLMKDTDVPFGRLQPYLGVGPTVFVATTKLNIGRDFQSTEADLGLAVESGIRYMIRKNLSANLSFRFRYVESHVDVDDINIFGVNRWRYIAMRTTYQQYDVILGVAYHF